MGSGTFKSGSTCRRDEADREQPDGQTSGAEDEGPDVHGPDSCELNGLLPRCRPVPLSPLAGLNLLWL